MPVKQDGRSRKWEIFQPSALPPPAECERRVQECDAVVAIIGFLWGSAVPGRPATSYVKLELEAAAALQKPTFVFVIDSAFTGFPAGMIQAVSPDERRLQPEFRQFVLTGPTCKTVESAQQLHHEVYRALSKPIVVIEDDNRLRVSPRVSMTIGRIRAPLEVHITCVLGPCSASSPFDSADKAAVRSGL